MHVSVRCIIFSKRFGNTNNTQVQSIQMTTWKRCNASTFQVQSVYIGWNGLNSLGTASCIQAKYLRNEFIFPSLNIYRGLFAEMLTMIKTKYAGLTLRKKIQANFELNHLYVVHCMFSFNCLAQVKKNIFVP